MTGTTQGTAASRCLWQDRPGQKGTGIPSPPCARRLRADSRCSDSLGSAVTCCVPQRRGDLDTPLPEDREWPPVGTTLLEGTRLHDPLSAAAHTFPVRSPRAPHPR